jgi:hypothetical protein
MMRIDFGTHHDPIVNHILMFTNSIIPSLLRPASFDHLRQLMQSISYRR